MSSPLMDKLELSMEEAFSLSQKVGNVGSWLFLMESREFSWSDEVYAIYGLPLDTPLTCELYHSIIHPEDCLLVKQNFTSIFMRKTYTSIHRVVAGEKTKWVEDRGQLRKNEKKGYTYVIGMVHDVTWMKEQQISIDRRWFEFNVITSYLAKTANTGDMESIIRNVKHTIRKIMDIEVVVLFVSFKGVYNMISSEDENDYHFYLNQEDEHYLAFQTLNRGRKLHVQISDYPHPESRERLKRLGVKSVWGMPLINGGEVIGGLSVALKREEPYENEIWFLETLGGYLSAQLKNAILYHQLKQELEERIRAEEKNRELQEFVKIEKLRSEIFMNVSHEFKTPLNVILSTVELVKAKLQHQTKSCDLEEYKRYADYVEQNAYRLLNLTVNLMDSAKLHHGVPDSFFKNCDLIEIISGITDSVSPYAANRNIGLQFISKIQEAHYLVCDREKIERILLNLLSNAIKNTPLGGTIAVSLWEVEEYFYISVEDNGIGIPEEILPFIFDKFKVGYHGLSRQSEGSGIGLSIVKELVKIHGGTIRADSLVGKETKIVFNLSKSLKPSVGFASSLNHNSLDKTRLKMEFSDVE